MQLSTSLNPTEIINMKRSAPDVDDGGFGYSTIHKKNKFTTTSATDQGFLGALTGLQATQQLQQLHQQEQEQQQQQQQGLEAPTSSLQEPNFMSLFATEQFGRTWGPNAVVEPTPLAMNHGHATSGSTAVSSSHSSEPPTPLGMNANSFPNTNRSNNTVGGVGGTFGNMALKNSASSSAGRNNSSSWMGGNSPQEQQQQDSLFRATPASLFQQQQPPQQGNSSSFHVPTSFGLGGGDAAMMMGGGTNCNNNNNMSAANFLQGNDSNSNNASSLLFGGGTASCSSSTFNTRAPSPATTPLELLFLQHQQQQQQQLLQNQANTTSNNNLFAATGNTLPHPQQQSQSDYQQQQQLLNELLRGTAATTSGGTTNNIGMMENTTSAAGMTNMPKAVPSTTSSMNTTNMEPGTAPFSSTTMTTSMGNNYNNLSCMPVTPGNASSTMTMKRTTAPSTIRMSSSSCSENHLPLSFLPPMVEEAQIVPWMQRSKFFCLGMDEDANWLSEFHCFVRQELVEVCRANQEDVRTRNNAIELEQVGIRCRYCAHLPANNRMGRSSAFPSSLKQIYQSFTMMLREHLPNCDCIPPHVQQMFTTLKDTTSQGASDSKRYWMYSATKLGLMDSPSECSGIVVTEQSRREGQMLLPFGTLPTAQPTDPNPDAAHQDIQVVVASTERPLLHTDFLLVLLQQVQVVHLREEERIGNRRSLQAGLPGLACRACCQQGRLGLCRTFPGKRRTLPGKMEDLYDHLRRCPLTQPSIQQRLEDLKQQEDHHTSTSNAANPDDCLTDRENAKEFFDRIWSRMGHAKPSSSPKTTPA